MRRNEGSEMVERARELEVAMLWGDQIINVRHIPMGDCCTLGSGLHADFQLYSDEVGECATLARVEAGGARISVPRGAWASIEDEVGEGAQARDGELLLGLDQSARLELGGLALVIRWVLPAVQAERRGEPFDFFFSKLLTSTFLAGAAALVAMTMTDMSAESLSQDLFRNKTQYAKVDFRAEVKEPKHKPLDFIVVKPTEDAPPENYRSGPHETKGGPTLDGKKRTDDRRKAMKAGLLGLLGSPEGSAGSILSGAGLGTGIKNALGGLTNSSLSDLGGLAGFGSRGFTQGGGGTGLSIGSIGTKSGGRGGMGDYGRISINGRSKEATRIIPGTTKVVGSCERVTIGNLISKRANEVRHCYEAELTKNPSLAGRVTASFTIGPTGGVESAEIAQSDVGSAKLEECIVGRIRRWKFPEPQGGGSCVINYPWVFKTAGGDEE